MSEEDALDLALAANLQAALLPKECPTDCPHQLAAARNRMCGSVGGDFYDFIHINEDQIALLVGDVIGHGVRASLVMAQIMGFLRSRPATLRHPSKILAELNAMLLELGERTDRVLACTMFYAVIDTPTGIGFFVNAGHPHPFLCDRNKCMTLHLGPRNLPLGVEPYEPTEGCHTFTPGQRLILYTDGLLDADNGDNERFGEKRFHALLDQYAGAKPAHCADAIFQAVEQFRNQSAQIDDETLVVIDRV